MFVLASASALASVLLVPCLSTLFPPGSPLRQIDVKIPATVAEIAGVEREVPLVPLLGVLAALSASVTWFLLRGKPWVWLLQDTLSVFVCILFVRTIRLPSLRIGTLFLGLMFCYDIFMVFISPVIFGKSIMLEVATAGQPTQKVDVDGVCERSEGETMPMLMLLPRTSGHAPAVVYDPPLATATSGGASSADVNLTRPAEGPPSALLRRLSGASGDFGMIGLGDIILPALVLTFGRRVDLAISSSPDAPKHLAAHSPLSSVRLAEGLPCQGYFLWGVIGYGVGLGVTLAANAFGWTFNGVQGQVRARRQRTGALRVLPPSYVSLLRLNTPMTSHSPSLTRVLPLFGRCSSLLRFCCAQPALLYLVPGVIGSLSLRALLQGELDALWYGSHLPRAPADQGQIACDGCQQTVRGDVIVFSDSSKNEDYCSACYELLPMGRRSLLVSSPVWKRCGVEPPRKHELL